MFDIFALTQSQVRQLSNSFFSIKCKLEEFDNEKCKKKFKEQKKAFNKSSEKYYSSMISNENLQKIKEQFIHTHWRPLLEQHWGPPCKQNCHP